MTGTRRSAWGSSFKLLAVPPSVCPHIPPAIPAWHQGAGTFTNSPGGPGGPTGPSGPGGPGSPKGPRGPGLPEGPGLPWKTEMLH
ncbi:PREDICTED: prostate collagen triple helix protein [Cariama cristata]|uniref:prostate collagen triple helix protein n=1 Tax=Cariama cristata TaxID=54380 RepID=UPI000520815D|nr:PREDICTED: prostate collagen triple helix protein [Cariama cristata]